MNYTETSAAIFNNAWFKDRVRVATSNYANYLLNTPAEDPEQADKLAVATRITQQYEIIVGQLMFTLSGDAEVQTAGPAIADGQLQQIVEKTIVKFVPANAPPIGTLPAARTARLQRGPFPAAPALPPTPTQ
jgi:hypothetical protein